MELYLSSSHMPSWHGEGKLPFNLVTASGPGTAVVSVLYRVDLKNGWGNEF
jgi:hypothetical protein